MSEQDRIGRDPDADDDIRALMQEADYDGRLRDDFKRTLLRELNHNFAYHRLRSRVLVAAVVVLGAGAALLQVTDVGGDSFALRPTGSEVAGSPVVRAPMTGDRFNAPAVDGDRDAGIAAAEDLHEQLAAGLGELVLVETWTIDGETATYLTLDLETPRGLERVMQVEGGSRGLGRKLLEFRRLYADTYLGPIERGDLGAQGHEVMNVRGFDLFMGTWTWDTPEFGRVVYRRGGP